MNDLKSARERMDARIQEAEAAFNKALADIGRQMLTTMKTGTPFPAEETQRLMWAAVNAEVRLASLTESPKSS